MAAGNYGGRISLLTCRKQNFKRLSPGSLTQTHTHQHARTHTHTHSLTPYTHHAFSPCPHPDSSHTLYYIELHQTSSSVCVCVCVPPEATWWIISMTLVALSFGPHLLSHSSCFGGSNPHNEVNPRFTETSQFIFESHQHHHHGDSYQMPMQYTCQFLYWRFLMRFLETNDVKFGQYSC